MLCDARRFVKKIDGRRCHRHFALHLDLVLPVLLVHFEMLHDLRCERAVGHSLEQMLKAGLHDNINESNLALRYGRGRSVAKGTDLNPELSLFVTLEDPYSVS